MSEPVAADRDTLRALPKAHLHVHLEGAIRATTVAELAGRYGRPPPRLEGWDDLAGFVAAYETARDLIRSLDDLRRVAEEVVRDAVADGFVWSEIHFAPLSYDGRLGAPEALVEATLEGLAAGAPARQHGAALILGHNRAQQVDRAARTLDLALAYRDHGVVGVGLVGDERHSSEPFAHLFRRAHDAGLASVPHAGETGPAAAVRTAVVDLDAERVGHGITAVDDPDVLGLLVDRNVCLDVCPTSNVRLGLVEDIARHPIRRLMEAGVAVTLNSDDPTFFGASALDEYAAAVEILGLDVRAIARSSIDRSRATEPVRQAALRASEAAMS